METLKKISIFLVLTLALSTLMLPGIAYGKGKPATPPGQIRLHAVGGKPSTPSVLARDTTGPAVGSIKGKGWKKFTLEGTVKGEPAYPNFTLAVKAGSVKRLKSAEGFPNVLITVQSITSEKGKTIYVVPKTNKIEGTGFSALKDGVRVNVKGTISLTDGKVTLLTATRVIIKPKRGKP